MSTCEAEYMALSEIGKKALWLRYIMVDLLVYEGQNEYVHVDILAM